MGPRTLAVMFGAVLAVISAGLGFGLLRVASLERGELAHEGEARPLAARRGQAGNTGVSTRLTEVRLEPGEEAVFEVCSDDRMAPEIWKGALEFVVFRLDPMSLMLRVPLDDNHLDHVRRDAEGACLQLGSGPIDQAGRYTVDAVWPDQPPPAAVTKVRLHARVLAREPLGERDRAMLGVLAGACLLLVALGWLRRRPTPDRHAAPRGHPLLMVVAVAGVFASGQLPLWGSALGLAKGILMALTQLGFALFFAHLAGLDVAATRPRRPALAALLAVATVPLLVKSAQLAMSLVPSTGVAPIQTFISWPSGMLAFALLGVALPLAEEVFFRGYLYGGLLRFGRITAFTLSVALFTGLHGQQSWGNWGALLAIFGTGVLLTGLRAWSGSLLPGAVAHVLYNLILALRSW